MGGWGWGGGVVRARETKGPREGAQRRASRRRPLDKLPPLTVRHKVKHVKLKSRQKSLPLLITWLLGKHNL